MGHFFEVLVVAIEYEDSSGSVVSGEEACWNEISDSGAAEARRVGDLQ